MGDPVRGARVPDALTAGGPTVAVRAPAHPIAQALRDAGNKVVSILGARTKDLIIMEEEMRLASDEVRVCTDDGSYGEHGLVTDVLKDIFDKQGKPGLVVAIGPVIMMKFVSKLTKEYGIPTVVSLNPIMVDGTGMCGGCRVAVSGESKFVCVDGPEFDALVERARELTGIEEKTALVHEGLRALIAREAARRLAEQVRDGILDPADIDEAAISAAQITYLEGYLWDPPPAKEAFVKAAGIAHGAGRKVALSLSDSFCVDRHRDEFRRLIEEHVDVVFANEAEILSLYQTSDFEEAAEAID